MEMKLSQGTSLMVSCVIRNFVEIWEAVQNDAKIFWLERGIQ